MAAPVLDSSSPFTNSPLPLAPRLPRGPVSPVAPRRTAVAAVVRPADLGLPCAALHLSGFSYERRLPAGRDSSPVCAIESQRAPAIPICAQGFGSQNGCSGAFGRSRAGLVGHDLPANRWWTAPVSNRSPPPCKGGALPTELAAHEGVSIARDREGACCPWPRVAAWLQTPATITSP